MSRGRGLLIALVALAVGYVVLTLVQKSHCVGQGGSFTVGIPNLCAYPPGNLNYPGTSSPAVTSAPVTSTDTSTNTTATKTPAPIQVNCPLDAVTGAVHNNENPTWCFFGVSPGTGATVPPNPQPGALYNYDYGASCTWQDGGKNAEGTMEIYTCR